MASPTVSTEFLILSDTHDFDEASGPFVQPIPEVDVVLHCGDLTQVGGLGEYKRALTMLSKIPAGKKLVIAGNHDLSLDNKYWQSLPAEEQEDEKDEHEAALKLMRGELAREAGVTYLEEGMHSIHLPNGAVLSLYATPYQPKCGDWAFSYEEGEDRFNSSEEKSLAQNPIPDFPGVDIMMTHGPPKGYLDECAEGHVGCEKLLQALMRAKPRMHCFGHIHEGYGATLASWAVGAEKQIGRVTGEDKNTYPSARRFSVDFGKETLMVNAAIMNERNKPNNSPWIIELDLPLKAK
ncbi:Metallo-dependent phosphatase [Acephala macrosclerotiorum]|nr:Metallo-dependent phosphatase [Acephala macrosclerotiorum]